MIGLVLKVGFVCNVVVLLFSLRYWRFDWSLIVCALLLVWFCCLLALILWCLLFWVGGFDCELVIWVWVCFVYCLIVYLIDIILFVLDLHWNCFDVVVWVVVFYCVVVCLFWFGLFMFVCWFRIGTVIYCLVELLLL